jgi:hypothetical protein
MKSQEAIPDETSVANALTRTNELLREGSGLQEAGFWNLVAKLRKNGHLAERFADEVAVIDRQAFESAVRARVPFSIGTLLLTGATVVGIAAVIQARVFPVTVRTLVFLAGFGILLLSTHSLTHVVVGRLMGIRFTHYFIGGPPPPRPGAKVDYASYLRAAPKRRAWMHASGAILTKILPFALIPWAMAIELHGWAIYLMLVVGVIQIVTDVLFSTKTSDWKKVRRELKAARSI